MKNFPELVVMLTHNDHTAENAREIFEQCKFTKAKYWGFKEKPLPLEDMKKLFSRMKEFGKTTFLEVVTYSEQEGLDGARIAAECQCDFLMGTKFFDSINVLCKENNIRYMPFVGKVSGRPSILEGTLDEMIDEARYCLNKGVYGLDLLGYRYTGDASALNKNFVASVNAPVCIAGSVNSFERLGELKKISAQLFTIGGAFFEGKFGGSFAEQVDKVCDFMQK